MTEVPEDQIRGLERQADTMDDGLERLQGDIDTAHKKAEYARNQATPEGVAGDWQDESAGAQQGDDARDAEGREGPGGERPGGEAGGDADAPVYEARQVDPDGSAEGESGEDPGDPEAA